MRKSIGWFLIGLPFAVVFLVIVSETELLVALGIFATAFTTAGIIALGVKMACDE